MSFSPMVIYSGRLMLHSISGVLASFRKGMLVILKDTGDLRWALIIISQPGWAVLRRISFHSVHPKG